MKLTMTPPQPPTFTLELTREELLVLRGLAFNRNGLLNAVFDTHIIRTCSSDGPKTSSPYDDFLGRVWSLSNQFLGVL